MQAGRQSWLLAPSLDPWAVADCCRSSSIAQGVFVLLLLLPLQPL